MPRFPRLFPALFAPVAVLLADITPHPTRPDRLVDTRGIDENYLIAGGLLVALGVAALLWWRWFKWQVHASSLMPAQRFESSRAEGA